MDLVAFANIKRYFPAPSTLSLLYNNDRPYKLDLIRLCPQIDNAHHLGHHLPIQGLSRRGVRASIGKKWMEPDLQEILENGIDRTLFFISSNIRPLAYYNFWPHARLRVPEEMGPELDARLLALGVDPDRFIVTVHCREPGYQFKIGETDGRRNADPFRYYEVMRHVIEQQGGQIVRIGDPSMTLLPETPGLTDLTRQQDELMLTARAISRARYALCNLSGCYHLMLGFHIPVILADVISLTEAPLYPEHIVLTKLFVDQAGRRFQQRAALEEGCVRQAFGDDTYALHDTPLDSLIRAADQMYEMTKGVEGWREPVPEPVWAPDPDFLSRLATKPPKARSDINFM